MLATLHSNDRSCLTRMLPTVIMLQHNAASVHFAHMDILLEKAGGYSF